MNRRLRSERGIHMTYEQIIISTLDSFGVSRSYTGYDYVVHGLLLIIEDRERLDCITKSLYLDIAKQYITTYMDRKNFVDSIFCQPCALSIK